MSWFKAKPYDKQGSWSVVDERWPNTVKVFNGPDARKQAEREAKRLDVKRAQDERPK
jgi:hypothetical protein